MTKTIKAADLLSSTRTVQQFIRNLSRDDRLPEYAKAALRVTLHYFPKDDTVISGVEGYPDATFSSFPYHVTFSSDKWQPVPSETEKDTPEAAKEGIDRTYHPEPARHVTADPKRKAKMARVRKLKSQHPGMTVKEIAWATGYDHRRVSEYLRTAWDGGNDNEQAALIRKIRAYHMDNPGKSYADIGRHFKIDRRRVGNILRG